MTSPIAVNASFRGSYTPPAGDRYQLAVPVPIGGVTRGPSGIDRAAAGPEPLRAGPADVELDCAAEAAEVDRLRPAVDRVAGADRPDPLPRGQAET
jgi:hypothetical protein